VGTEPRTVRQLNIYDANVTFTTSSDIPAGNEFDITLYGSGGGGGGATLR
jgi:hypothetical protein